MSTRRGWLASGLLAACALGVPSVPSAAADPIFSPPPLGEGILSRSDDGALYGLVGEARLLGVAGAARLATFPDRRVGLEADAPLLLAGRAGVVWHLAAPWTFVLRVDLAEATRLPETDGSVVSAAAALVDDAYALYRPGRAFTVAVGQLRVPFTKLRQFEESDLALGGVPFVVDRVAPDRRAGLMLVGDLGALAWAAGVYEDRLAAAPPGLAPVAPGVADGAAVGVLHIEWTPVAPMMGSNPPGRVLGARGPLPTPRTDPWFATLRPSLGLSVLARLDEAGATTTDAALSLQFKWRAFAALAEGLVVSGGGRTAFGAWSELMFTPTDRLALAVRAEWDGGAGASGEYSAGGGFAWSTARDRRSRIGLFAFVHRDVERGTAYDGALVIVQAVL